jgi:DNA-binding transcriptional regulator YdaS (Cro superfamily)
MQVSCHAEGHWVDSVQEVCKIQPMPNYDAALVRVLEAAGGPTKVAEHLGVVPSAVTQWTRVPARHIHRLEALTGIPARDIRPDLWDTPAVTQAAE